MAYVAMTISTVPKKIPMTPTISSIRSTYVVRKLKYMKKSVLNAVATRNNIIEKVCSVRFAWYPKQRRKSWMKKKNTMVVNSSSQIEGGKIKAPPITTKFERQHAYLYRLKSEREILYRTLNRLYQNASQLGVEVQKKEFKPLYNE